MGRESSSAAEPPGPTIDQVRAFVACAVHGNYKAAARSLGVDDHKLIVRRVSRLGAALGTKLVRGDRHGALSLTADGVSTLEAAQRLVQAADDLRATRPAVRFSSYPSVAQQVLERCSDLLVVDPPLVLTGVSDASRGSDGGDLLRRLRAHLIDLAVAPDDLAADGLTSTPLYQWRLRASGPGLSGRREISLRDLLDRQIAVAPPGHRSRSLLDGLSTTEGVELAIACQSASPELLRAFAIASPTHVAVLPDDAFGSPAPFGPILRSSAGHAVGGTYSLFRRRGDTERDRVIAQHGAIITERLGPSGSVRTPS